MDSRRAHNGESSTHSAQGEKLGEKMSRALADAMDPDGGHLAKLCGQALWRDAIRRDRFWIFTEPRLLRHVRPQFDAMVDERALSRLRLV